MSDEMVCFFVKERRLERLDLPSLTKSERVVQIKVVKIKMVRLSFIYRFDVFYEKHFIMKGKNTECLHELKLKFLNRLCEKEQQYEVIYPNSVWFILDNKLVSEQVLQSALCTSFSTRLLSANQSWGTYGSGIINNLRLYVHFQPPDAIPVSVIFKPDPGKANKIERLTVISPLISEQDLRQEVARVVEVEPEALKILVGKKKLDAKLDIQQSLLSEPNVFVEVKPEMGIEVEIVFVPELQGNIAATSVRMYPYDIISKLKSEVCNLCHVGEQKVDIWFGDKFLADKMTANECRLRDADLVKAYVFKKRVCIRVRRTNRRLYEIIVDDAGRTTVGDIKTFVESTDKSSSVQHQFSVLAIFNGSVLEDHEILINTGLCSKQKTEILVLFQTNTVCFTASSSLNGKFPVFRDTGEGWFQPTLAMSDGKELFYAPESSQTMEKILSLVEERRLTPSVWTECALGIHVRPPSQLPQQNERQRHRIQSRDLTDPTPRKCKDMGCNQRTASAPEGTSLRRCISNTQVQHVKFEEEDCTTDSPSIETDFMAPMESTFRTSTPEPGSKLSRTLPEGFPEHVTRDMRVSRGRTLNPSFSLPGTTEEIKRYLRDRPFISDGECGRTAEQNIIHKSATFQCLEEKKDGKYVLRKYSESETLLPADAAHKQLASGSNWTAVQNSDEEEKKFCCSTLQCVPDMKLIICDSTFRCIRQATVNEISKKVGRDGLRLFRQLGVLEETMEQAQEAQPRNLAERNYFLLTCWCRSAGVDANPETLKAALKQCRRNDLVAMVDDLEATPATC